MEYKGKLYGHLGDKKYFDTGKTADDWDNLEKRIAELEAENKALSMSGVSDSFSQKDMENFAAKCMILGHGGKTTEELLKDFCDNDR